MIHDQMVKKILPMWTHVGADFLSAFIIRKCVRHETRVTTSVGKPQVGDACQVCTLQNSELTYSMRQKREGKELHPSANNHRPYPALRLSQALGAVQLEAAT
jgi:hypothetical protein